MTATLPHDVRQVFDRFITTEYVTIDAKGQPIAWPVTPYHHPQEGCVDITTGLGYPKKARDAQANPHVALLFSEPNGSGLDAPPMVLVQGTAQVDDQNLESNWLRYERESAEKLPAAYAKLPPRFIRRRLLAWYFMRLYVHVRPERVYVWPEGDPKAEPQLLDAHMEEVRSGHNEEPEESHETAPGAAMPWDPRLDGIGSRQYPTAVVAVVGPDGFPFAVRLPVTPDRGAGLLRLGAEAVGAPLAPGKACIVVHSHNPEFTWQLNFQVRGDLVPDGDGWALVPRKLVGGFQIPKGNVAVLRENAKKMRRYHKVAKAELAKRGDR